MIYDSLNLAQRHCEKLQPGYEVMSYELQYELQPQTLQPHADRYGLASKVSEYRECEKQHMFLIRSLAGMLQFAGAGSLDGTLACTRLF